jgi:anti-anti-sigma factor
MGQLVTRLIRDANSVWLLELIRPIEQELFFHIWAGEIEAILKLLEQSEAQKLVIDLTATQEVDSRGLQFLCRMHKELAERNIPIILRNPSAHLRRVLRIMKYDQLFGIEFDDSFSSD